VTAVNIDITAFWEMTVVHGEVPKVSGEPPASIYRLLPCIRS
jgi:hypothetical protein